MMAVKAPLRRAMLIVALLLISWAALQGPLDTRATRAVESGLKRALITFAIARGLNAVISAAQGTEVSLAPAGVGVTLTPGEALDPVNDLVERFSWVMLLSSVSLGAQRVLLELSAWPPFSLLLSGVMLVAVASHWWAPAGARNATRWLRNLVIVLIALRFALPLTVIGSEWTYQQFLADRHQQSEAGLARSRDQVAQINDATQAAHQPADGLLERARQWAEQAKGQWSGATDLQRYQDAVAESARDTVELIVVFLLHTLLLPLALLWLIGRLTQRLLLSPSGQSGPSGHQVVIQQQQPKDQHQIDDRVVK